MSLETEQVTRERLGPGAEPDHKRAKPTLAEETVPLRDAGHRELDRRREERVRLVVAGSRHRRRPGLPTVALALVAVLVCAGTFAVLDRGSSAPPNAEVGPSAPASHPVAVATDHAGALRALRLEARRHAEGRTRREDARRRRLAVARQARAKARKERAAARRREAPPAVSARTSDAGTVAPEEATTEEVAPVAEEPAFVAPPEPAATERSTSSTSEATETQKEFGFER